MIGSMFNMSAANFGNAAMRAARISWDSPVELQLGACGPNEKDAYIEVSSPSGHHEQIPIDAGRLAECRQENDGPIAMAKCQQFVDDLATQIRRVVDDALASETEIPGSSHASK